MRNLQAKLFVNWKDGMRLSREHLVQQTQAIKDKLRDVAACSLTPYSYGLLAPAQGQPESLSVSLNSSRPGQLEATLSECSALLPGGQRVEISARAGLPLDLDRRTLVQTMDLTPLAQLSEVYLVLAAHPFEEVAAGPVDEEENPPRPPFVNVRYSLHLISPSDQTDPALGSGHMPIGRIRLINGAVSLDETYIPPCATLTASASLMELHSQLLDKLGQMERDLATSLQYINEREALRITPRLGTGRAVCQAALTYLSHHLFELRTLAPHRSPVHLVGFFSGLARSVYNALQARARNGKDEYLGTVRPWLGAQSEVEAQLQRLINLDYHHMDAARTLQDLRGLMGTLIKLFAKMAELKWDDTRGFEGNELDPFAAAGASGNGGQSQTRGNEQGGGKKSTGSWF